MLDFNDTQTPVPRDLDAEREAIRVELLVRLESVLAALFPAGKKRGGKEREAEVHEEKGGKSWGNQRQMHPSAPFSGRGSRQLLLNFEPF